MSCNDLHRAQKVARLVGSINMPCQKRCYSRAWIPLDHSCPVTALICNDLISVLVFSLERERYTALYGMAWHRFCICIFGFCSAGACGGYLVFASRFLSKVDLV